MQNEATGASKEQIDITRDRVDGNKEAAKEKWHEKGIKIIPAVIAVPGFLFGIYTFQAQQRTTQTQGFKIKLWDKKLDVYNQLVGVAGDIIIYRNDTTALDSLTEKFDKIYYSSLILVQNDSVEHSVRLYKDALADYREGIKSILFLKDKQISLKRKIGQALKVNQDFD